MLAWPVRGPSRNVARPHSIPLHCPCDPEHTVCYSEQEKDSASRFEPEQHDRSPAQDRPPPSMVANVDAV